MIATWALALALVGPRDYEGPTDVPVQVALPPRPEPPRPIATKPVRTAVRPFGRVRARWGVDAAITAGAGIPVLVLNQWVAPQLPRAALPTDPPDLGRVDALARGRFDPRVSVGTDVLVAVLLAAAPLVSLVDGHWAAKAASDHRRRAFATKWATAVLVEAESVAVAALLTNALKFAVSRPRPYTSLAEADVAAGDRDALRAWLRRSDRSHSFPSGHSTLAFAAVTSLATTLTLDAPRTRGGRVAVALAWSLGLAAAGTAAVLRVVAGKHYPSDVVAGSAIGSAVGVATPLLHARPRWRGRR